MLQEKLIRLPIVLFTIITPLLFILSIGTVLASPPTANDDAYTTNEDTTLVITAPGVLENDHDASSATAILDAVPVTGTVELLSSGAFTYTPLLDFSGIVTFSYYISKTGEISSLGNVFVTVTAVNDPPTATNDHAT
ncbi:MAG: cadherin-like domain-containing protein, partial [Anaerolineales bacterium]|nr:cadherin-like domain-containing protein [Anaerolineales bacterium]